MKTRYCAPLMVVLSLWLIAAAACGGGGGRDADVAVALTQTAAALAQVPTATAVPTVAPSPTPVPPSPTPAPPSATPLPPPSPTPAPPTAADRFATAGLTEKEVGDCLQALQAAVAQDNRGQVADLVAFPLDVTLNGAKVTLGSKEQFVADYSQIINPQVKAAILGQTVAGLFVNWQGVMIGDGEVWLGGVGNGPPFQVRVIAINNGAPPPAAGGPAPVRLSFEPGGTSVSVEGKIEAGGVNDYVINAMAGQTMMVSLDSLNRDVFLTIYGVQDGQPLVRSALGQTMWTGTLPGTQDYMVKAVSEGAAATTYWLQVVIPARIKFAPGATSALVQGNVTGGSIVRYLLRAMAGQTMTVTVTSPRQDVLLTIWGLEDGQPLVRSVSGATSWTGVLPATQDYVIDAVSVGDSTTYTVETTVK